MNSAVRQSASSPARMAKTADYASFRSRRYFPVLDGLRALSILLVLTWHVDEHRWRYLSGYSGVMIFFVLSGFLIHTLLLREEDAWGAVSLKAFYLRRSFRILPLYFVVLGLYAVLVQFSGFARQASAFHAALPYYLTGFNDFAPLAPFNQSWSLGVEEKFYLVWPLAGFVLLSRWKPGRMTVMLLLAVAPLLLAANGHLSALASYAMIMSGCALGACLDNERVYEAIRSFLAGIGFLLVPALWLTFHALLGVYPDRGRLLYGYLLMGYTISITLLLAWAVVAWSPVHRLLGLGWVRHLGQRSYGMYLVHLLCLSALQRVLHPVNAIRTWLLLLATVALSLAAAEVLYRLVEHPAISMGRRVKDRWLPRARTPEIVSPALK